MKPFPSRKRNTILILGAIIFICLIPFLVLSAMGYKIDFQPKDGGTDMDDNSFLGSLISVEKTGGIYVRSDLFGTIAYINNKEFTDRGILSRNIFAQDLVPGTYEVKIQKDGYRDWVRNIIVSPNKVTEAYLFTLPTEIIFTEIPQYLDSNGMPTTTAPLSKTSSKIININPEYKEVLKLFTNTSLSSSTPKVLSSIRNNIKSSATTSSTTLANLELDKKLIYGNEVSRNLYATSTGSKIKFTWDGGYDQTPYYFCKFEICEKTAYLNLDETIKKFYLFPGRDDIVIIENSTGIYYADLGNAKSNKLENIYKKDKTSVYVRGGEIFIKDGAKIFIMTY